MYGLYATIELTGVTTPVCFIVLDTEGEQSIHPINHLIAEYDVAGIAQLSQQILKNEPFCELMDLIGVICHKNAQLSSINSNSASFKPSHAV